MLRILATAALTLAGLATVGTTAQAAPTPPTPIPTETLSLQNVGSGDCLGLVPIGGRHRRIGFAACTFTADQLWAEQAPLSATRSWLVLRSTGGCLDVDVNPGESYGTDTCGDVTLPGGHTGPDPSKYWTRVDLGNGTYQLLGIQGRQLGEKDGTWFLGATGAAPTPETTWHLIPEGAA